jgi:hypothetical protein
MMYSTLRSPHAISVVHQDITQQKWISGEVDLERIASVDKEITMAAFLGRVALVRGESQQQW